ncbi:predicted protein [Postia placenta Mad-698-R]|nr:predicted protein [Postia placenta Mad-698-R]
MDRSPVPFPTLPLQAEETHNADSRPALSSRVHSSPSLPNLWLPAPPGSAPPRLAQRFQARYRPHLRPLDLAATPDTSPSKSKYTQSKRSTSGSPCRPAVLLTPPLTPSSSFNSATNDGPSTPPEANSPLRCVYPTDRTFNGPPSIIDSPTALKGHAPLPQGGYLTPSSGRSHSMSSETDSGYAVSATSAGPDAVSALAAGLADTDITPRDERKASFCVSSQPAESASSVDIDFSNSASEIEPSHFLLASHGVIIIAFFDIRESIRAQRQIPSQSLPGLEEACLDASCHYGGLTEIHFFPPTNFQTIGRSSFINETDGALFVSVGDHRFQAPALQNLLSSFGELKSFELVDPHDQTYHVEYYDIRDAHNAHRALHSRTFLGVRLHLYAKKDLPLEYPAQSDDPFQITTTITSPSYQPSLLLGSTETIEEQKQQADREMRFTQGHVSASESIGAPDAVRRLWKGRESPQEHSRRCSNDLFFDSVGKVIVSPQTPSRPRSISIGPDDLAGAARHQRTSENYAPPSPAHHFAEVPRAQPYTGSPAMYVPQDYAFPTVSYPAQAGVYAEATVPSVANIHWAYAAPPVPAIEGKEALVEKFKNSCIMDERESWRPKIFYSDGPDQGLPEPFPAPTHLRRKERSSHNRGALFVPGPNYQRREASESPSLFHRRPHPPRMSAR